MSFIDYIPTIIMFAAIIFTAIVWIINYKNAGIARTNNKNKNKK